MWTLASGPARLAPLALLGALACSGPATDTAPADTDADTDTDTDTDADTDTDTDTAVPICGAEGAERRYCASCAELLAVAPGTDDGPVTLAPDAGAAIDTWCEMTTAGGGWTLIGTNGWGGAWDEATILDTSVFGAASLTEDFKSRAFAALPFTDLYFGTDVEYAVYPAVGDGNTSYQGFQQTVPLHNCGIDTPYEWEMSEGTLDDPDICSTNLYIHPIDWEGGLIPCGDSEVAFGPAWSAKNKDLGCPLNDPKGTTFIIDPWDYNPWGDHDPAVPNAPLRMWAR